MEQSIENRAAFDFVRYANCWEDADLLCAALRPAPGRRMLCVASGGDNSFALLAEGAEVVAADLSPAQLALVELKAAAIARLPHPEALAFLGITPSAQRPVVLRELLADLSPSAREYWQRHPQLVAAGVIHQGKFERYFHLFRRRVLPLIHSRARVTQLLEQREPEQRRAFYQRRWNTLRWRLLFRVFFSRFIMARFGRDPAFFHFVEGDVATRILARARYALTELPTHTNPYLTYILTGNFGPPLPRYLRPEVYPQLQQHLSRLTLVQGPIQEVAQSHAASGFDGFNLSDVFEYLSPELCQRIFTTLCSTAHPGARLAYWNMLVPRSCPSQLGGLIRPLRDEAGRLFATDRAFFYSAFVLEEIL